jgi:hypothetical protein
MNKKPDKRIFGLTQNELLIFVILGGLLLCVIVLFVGYIIYNLSRPNPIAVLLPTSIPQPIQQSVQPNIKPTNSPLPVKPSDTPIPQPTLTRAPTYTPAPTNTPQMGTFNNPVPIGVGYTFPGFGTLTVVSSSWIPGQTGFAIVDISFSCQRPAGQKCDTGDFMFDALGGSGNGYGREFDTAIPDPWFGTFNNPPVYGGGVEKGFAGFLITKNENILLMRVRLFLEEGELFFKISK